MQVNATTRAVISAAIGALPSLRVLSARQALDPVLGEAVLPPPHRRPADADGFASPAAPTADRVPRTNPRRTSPPRKHDNSGRVRCRELLTRNMRNFGRMQHYTEEEADAKMSRRFHVD